MVSFDRHSFVHTYNSNEQISTGYRIVVRASTVYPNRNIALLKEKIELAHRPVFVEMGDEQSGRIPGWVHLRKQGASLSLQLAGGLHRPLVDVDIE